MLRAETADTSLKTAGAVVSESLLVAMLLKGLPPEFMPFSTVITQRDKALTFSEFKAALRGLKKQKKSFNTKVEDSVMKVGVDSSSRQTVSNHSNPRPNQSNSEGGANKQSNGIVCYSCNKPGHKSSERFKKKKKYCNICKNHSHDTRVCRKKDYINNVNNSGNNHDNPRSSSNSFIFNVGLDVDALDNIHEVKGMLVDCGATHSYYD